MLRLLSSWLICLLGSFAHAGTCSWKPGAAATTRRFQTETSAAAIATTDKLFWVMLSRLWVGWRRALIVVQPETVVRWHRTSSSCIGRGFRDTELDGQKVRESGTACPDLPHGDREPDLGAPRIHGELKMLGFEISERTVLRWIRRAPRSPEPAK